VCVCVERSQWAGHVVRTFDKRIPIQILEQCLGQRRHTGMAKCRRMPSICSIQKNWHTAARHRSDWSKITGAVIVRKKAKEP